MLRKMTLSVFALAGSAMAASAADLPVQSRLGAVFAEPAPYQAPATTYRTYGYPTAYAPEIDIRPLVAGYYGKPNSYYYSPYYGRPLDYDFARLPYACGFYGYC